MATSSITNYLEPGSNYSELVSGLGSGSLESTKNLGNNDQQYSVKTDIRFLLPYEIALIVFSFFTEEDLLNCSLVSKHFKQIVGDRKLWEVTANNLGISSADVKSSAEDYRKAVCTKIHVLKLTISKVDLVLHTSVKTAWEFDKASNPILHGYSKRSDAENNSIMKGLAVEINTKLELHDQITDGFNAHMKLNRIGRSKIEKISEYAIVLSEKYGQEDIWANVAIEYVKLNKNDQAIDLLTTKLQANWKRDDVILNIVYKLCDEKKIEEAFAFFIKHTVIKDNYTCDQECVIGNILLHAKELKRFDLVEKVIDFGVENYHRLTEIVSLVLAHKKEGNRSKALELMTKYKADLEGATQKWDSPQVIELYVKMGKLDQAWELTNLCKNTNKLALYYLHNALQDEGYEKEVAKVMLVIEKENPLQKKNSEE